MIYCSSCGSAVNKRLAYCNQCGARMGSDDSPDTVISNQPSPESLVRAIVTVFIVGLGATIGLIAVMKGVGGFNEGMILGVTMLSLLLMVAVEAFFIWLLLRPRKKPKDVSRTASPPELSTNGLSAERALALPDRGSSITEQTTRTLQPEYDQRRDEMS